MKSTNLKIINEFLNYLEKERKYSKHTIRCYKTDLREFKQYLNDKNLLKIDRLVIQKFIQKISIKGVGDKTLQRKVCCIKSFYRYLSIKEKIKYNITELIASPRVVKKLPNYLTVDEINKLMKLPDLTSFSGVRDRSILEILYSTGIRIFELINIHLQDIELKQNIIKIFGKGKKDRRVIVGSKASRALQDYLKIRINALNNQSKYLYPALKKDSKNHISNKTVYNIVKKYLLKISNNEKLSPHSLRHSFATHLLDNGADLMSVKDLLGHEDLSSTQVYTHVSIKKIKEIYKIAHPHGK